MSRLQLHEAFNPELVFLAQSSTNIGNRGTVSMHVPVRKFPIFQTNVPSTVSTNLSIQNTSVILPELTTPCRTTKKPLTPSQSPATAVDTSVTEQFSLTKCPDDQSLNPQSFERAEIEGLVLSSSLFDSSSLTDDSLSRVERPLESLPTVDGTTEVAVTIYNNISSFNISRNTCSFDVLAMPAGDLNEPSSESDTEMADGNSTTADSSIQKSTTSNINETKEEHYDQYGFILTNGELENASIGYSLAFLPKAKRRESRWNHYLSKNVNFKDKATLKVLIRKGIPKDLRVTVWSHCLGSDILQSKNQNVYERLAAAPLLDKAAADQIELDIPRTFPNNKAYKNHTGEDSLRRVLRAFAAYKPHIGYCQSLNFIAGTLLLVLPEELAFWSLCQIVDSETPDCGMRIAGYYTPGMNLLRTDIKTLTREIKERVPQVYKALEKNEVQIDFLCAEWFLCLFCTTLPIETLLRVWDVLLNEGIKIIFRVAIAVFRFFRNKLTKQESFEDMMTFFRANKNDLVNHNEIMKIALFSVKNFSSREIDRFRKICSEEVQEENERLKKASK
ncbi:TBC domain-containing protein [Cardiosporidium cionae]|uniref:TBC domain-containing protein n=1 Tax=Cardiosporidium cionae TaxID=476202 RepID=A0ABQ7JD66_9APIC|nr:TBC domain-containing protein [Cardiosporidium cionae]|eukprot:KAF8821934.1 TBC domain-containing protein [Cardiosporidium cionae]